MLLVMDRTRLNTYDKKYGAMLAFLALELLLFTSLNLANYGMLFRYLAIVLALALLPLVFLHYKKEDWLNLALLFVLPLFMYGAFMAFSPLYLLLHNVVDDIVMVLALESFMLVGVALAKSPDFKIEKGLAAIVGGMGLLLFISFVYTMWRYTPFYVLRFEGQVLYFDGERYLISEEAKWLFGFSFKEVKLSYFLQTATMLTPLLAGLLFVPWKKISKLDYAWIAAGVVGLLAIVSLPAFDSLVYVVPALAVAVLLRFYPRGGIYKKVMRYGLFAILGLFALAAVFLVLFAFEVPFAMNLVENTRIFGLFYGNPLVRGYAEVIQAAFAHPFGGLHSIFVNNGFLESTGSAVFDTLYQGGFFAAIGYVAMIVIGGFVLTDYYRKADDAPHVKTLIIVLALTFVFYTAFHFEYAPFVRETDRIYKTPFFSDLNLLIVIFLLGYAYSRTKKEIAVTKTDEGVNPSSVG